jgi:hypothetical protein
MIQTSLDEFGVVPLTASHWRAQRVSATLIPATKVIPVTKCV